MTSNHETGARAMVAAAAELLDALDSDQRSAAWWPFPSDEERRRWFYTPTDHGGLPMAAMESGQHRLVHRLLATGLSRAGHTTTAAIIALEDILDSAEGFSAGFGRQRGRDPLLYWVAIFGTPAQSGTWGWRFGGHHISLHFTMVDGRLSSATPCFFGANPASTPLLGPHLHRPLGGAEDIGRELVRSLTTEQSGAAILTPVAPPDLVSANRAELHEGDKPLPLPQIWRGRFEANLERALAAADTNLSASLGVTSTHLESLAFSNTPRGLAAPDLQPSQTEILRELLGVYVERIHDDFADLQVERFAGDRINDLHFAWAGGVEVGQPHYYRIQGPELLVEYDNAQDGGNHIHSVWRDLAMDFGGDPLAEHYAEDHADRHR